MRHYPELASYNNCTGCMACIDACNHDVLKLAVDDDGYYKIDINSDKCIGCNLCSMSCPIISPIELLNNEMTKIFASWSMDSDLRQQSASGGIFASLASLIINRGGVVYGAAIDKFDVKHKRIETLHELFQLQGSKYQHSIMTGIYRHVRKDLVNGREVLFSGLSCEISGLKKFLRNINQEKLITVDMICGGVSTLLPMINLKLTHNYTGIVSFRDKDNGWKPFGFKYNLKMMRTDGKIENLGSENMVLCAFSSKILKRASCCNCKFTGLKRNSDITIGDFWGEKKYSHQHNAGVSALLIHSDKGYKYIQDSKVHIEPAAIEEISVYNPNLISTSYPLIPRLHYRKKVLKYLKNNDIEKAQNLLRMNGIMGYIIRLYLKITHIYHSN
ncbi:Coenzyme F420 hydrogenase/dehydrogenase, beta subunit C-terminal domain [Muribaculum intestinale]|uniref:Coenzyme F420 hydrogenase/dehydrogenase, beta subunit C-terminal domain n=1 Tax=Muribaculum intestinale TaxID=1796646 RepID=UPI0024305E99|nr:Coenzyme F420 hydrogenase/dehydrogenase, beta subunit C-terminal domain [Muribaculum intestinale]